MTITLRELAQLVGGEVRGKGDRLIEGVRSLDIAGPQHLSFVTNPRYRKLARKSNAGAILTDLEVEGSEADLILVPHPYVALAMILEHFHPQPPRVSGIDSTARIDESAIVDKEASIAPYAVIGARSEVGPGTVIMAHAVIGADCVVGNDTVLHPHVVLYDDTVVGARCILHAGVIIGSDGFGFAFDGKQHRKLQHVGRVVIEDDVEIGANTTIDRALLEETRIGAGSKIDNLVQVAHNVRLGRGCLLVSQVGIAGSSELGDGVVVGGQAGISGHVRVGDGSQIAAKSAVFRSVGERQAVAGIPAIEMSKWRRQQALAARLDELKKRLQRLEAGRGGREEEGDDETG